MKPLVLCCRSLLPFGNTALAGGFQADSVLVTEINFPGPDYPDYRDVARGYEQLINGVEEIPGVVAAGVMSELPLGASIDFVFSWTVLGREDPGDPPRSRMRQLSPGVFETMGLEIVEGRAFTEDDRFDVAGAAVLNETFARTLFGNTSALGQQMTTTLWREGSPLGINYMESYEVVGVVKDVRHASLDEPAEPAVYMPLDQFPVRRTFLTTRVTGREPTSIADEVRTVIRELDPTIPVEFTTMEAVLAESVSGERLAMLLLLAFGLTAATLAAVGIYGVISSTVTRRMGEMAIRTALGAEKGTVLWLSMAQGVTLSAGGIILGVGGAYVGRRLIASQLYEISATDPLVMVGAPMFLAVVAFIAVLIPALRATRVDLAHTLRTE